MKVSLIIAVYKDVAALRLIIDALKQQTYKNFEVIVAEDGQHEAMANFIKTVTDLEIKHTTQEDIGVRKARSQNNGIIASTGDYLIFIDGDCIPYTTFIAAHVALAKQATVLSGRRVNLSPTLTEKIKTGKTTAQHIERFFLRYIALAFEKNSKYEYGFYFAPLGFLYQWLFNARNRNTSLLGCNFSCFKADMLKINGFDEGYGETSLSDDTDLDWRFRALGLDIKSCKNAANMFHLWHAYNVRDIGDFYVQKMKDNQQESRYVCNLGISEHSSKQSSH